MNFLHDGILQFIYPQKTTCLLCGQLLFNGEQIICRVCYLELIWDSDNSGKIPGMASFQEVNLVRLRAVGKAEGRMKQLMMLLSDTPDQQALELASTLIIRKAGAWLASGDMLAVLPDKGTSSMSIHLGKQIRKQTGISLQILSPSGWDQSDRCHILDVQRLSVRASKVVFFAAIADPDSILPWMRASQAVGDGEIRFLALARRVNFD